MLAVELLKSSAFITSLNMHLYQNNINLQIDIPCSLPLSYIVESLLISVVIRKKQKSAVSLKDR